MKKSLFLIFMTSKIFTEESFFAVTYQGISERWNMLSCVHQMILISLAVVMASWILIRLLFFKYRSLCGCGCENKE